MSDFFNKNPGILYITAIYLICFCLILPLREVAFFDDFAYIQTVENFLLTGQLKISDWSGTAFVFPAFWGALFAKLFGFSIQTLIISNLFLFYLALLSFYFTLKKLGSDELKTVIFSLFLFSYPWIFQFSYTFMSDIFYLSALCFSLFFFISASKNNSHLMYLLGSFFIGISFITRQIGVSILLAIFITLIYESYTLKKIDFRKYLSILTPAISIISLYYIWINQPQTMPYGQYIFFTVPIKEEILFYLFPSNLKYTPISNSLYYEILVQRVIGYFAATSVFLLPMIFFFKLNLSRLFLFLKNSSKFLIISLVLIFLYFISQHLKGFKFVVIPHTVIRYDQLFINWSYWWNSLLVLCIPVWLILLTFSLKRITTSFFVKRTQPLFDKSKFLPLGFSFALVTFILYFNLASTLNPYKVKFTYNSENLPKSFSSLVEAIDSSLLPETFLFTISEVWLLTIFYFFIFISILLVLFKYKLKISKDINLNLLFINLSLLFHFLITIFLAYGFWEEYIIPFIPLIIISLNILMKKYPLVKNRSALIILLMLILSVGITRNRIQDEGVKWSLATNLLRMGIQLYQIPDPNWAWTPYWYFDVNFQKEVQKVGGDKYKVTKSGYANWNKEIPKERLYDFVEIFPDQNLDDISNLQFVSEPFWIFNRHTNNLLQQKKIGIIKLDKPTK